MAKLSRYRANCLIMAKLQRILDANPDWRFHQALQNSGISSSPAEDQFYEESEKTLANLNKVSPDA